MVEFDIGGVQNGMIEIGNLYAIYGNDKDGVAKLLIVGGLASTEGKDIPVIDVTDCSHNSLYYRGDDSAADVCEDFDIDPLTAKYLDDYAAFTLVFQHDERED